MREADGSAARWWIADRPSSPCAGCSTRYSRRAGASFDDHVSLRPLEILARHAWSATERFDLFADINRAAAAVGDFSGAAEARRFLAFCEEARRIYRTLKEPFLAASRPGPLRLSARIGLHRPGALLGIKPFTTMWGALCRHFHDPRLRQLFGRYATYNGASPFAAPATLMLIAHVEQEGVWTIAGGMQRLAEAMEKLARARGVEFRFGVAAERILMEGGRASGVVLATGEHLMGDAVVVNADFGAGGWPVRRRCGARRQIRGAGRPLPVGRHLGDDSPDTRLWPAAAQCFLLPGLPGRIRPDLPASAPARGTHNLCLRPGSRRRPRGAGNRTPVRACERARRRRQTEFRDRGDRPMPDRSSEPSATVRPVGNAAGKPGHDPIRLSSPISSDRWSVVRTSVPRLEAAFRRPGSATKIPGLYLAGGSTHPGAGVPMAALSGQLAAQRLLSDRASMPMFRQAAISGGISTLSAVTDVSRSP
jgi:1-hydroxycarotenoid 3,4-desaturase